jgi:cellobiose phosphorylase
MMLPSQVFAIMSGAPSKEQIRKTCLAIGKYLKDKQLGGIRLNTDLGELYPALGRAFSFSYGDKENGAFFNHMVVMLANALYKRGFIKEGFRVIDSIYKMAIHPHAAIYPMIPEYFNQEGKGLYLYLTGSASWYIHTLIDEVLGIKFLWGDISLEPKLMGENFFKNNIEIRFNAGKKVIKATFIKGQKRQGPYRIKSVLLENKKISPLDSRYIIKKEALGKLKKKEINIKIYLA